MQHPEDVEDHDESWHYETSEDHVLFHESMVQPQKASYDNQTDSHVPTGPSSFLLQTVELFVLTISAYSFDAFLCL
jgi:hypothetical protein